MIKKRNQKERMLDWHIWGLLFDNDNFRWYADDVRKLPYAYLINHEITQVRLAYQHK